MGIKLKYLADIEGIDGWKPYNDTLKKEHPKLVVTPEPIKFKIYVEWDHAMASKTLMSKIYINYDGSMYLIDKNHIIRRLDNKLYTVLLRSGKTDKNGANIYDGDIIVCHDVDHLGNPIDEYIRVNYDRDLLEWFGDNGDCSYELNEVDTTSYEIVGHYPDGISDYIKEE